MFASTLAKALISKFGEGTGWPFPFNVSRPVAFRSQFQAFQAVAQKVVPALIDMIED